MLITDSETVRLVRVGPDEIKALQTLSIRTFTEAFSKDNEEANMQAYLNTNLTEEKLTAEMSHPGSQFYFAVTGDRNIGYLKINFGQAQTDLQDESSLEIERIYILSEFQGKKIGQFLLDQALLIAAEQGLSYIWLGVWDKNQGAIKFYGRNGFAAFDQHPFMLGTEEQTDIMMKRPV